jgi:hypothetical protein
MSVVNMCVGLVLGARCWRLICKGRKGDGVHSSNKTSYERIGYRYISISLQNCIKWANAPGADEEDDHKAHGALQEREDVVDDGPALSVPLHLLVVVVGGVGVDCGRNGREVSRGLIGRLAAWRDESRFGFGLFCFCFDRSISSIVPSHRFESFN